MNERDNIAQSLGAALWNHEIGVPTESLTQALWREATNGPSNPLFSLLVGGIPAMSRGEWLEQRPACGMCLINHRC